MDLQKIRDRLDVIDAEFVRLFEERMRLVGQVAEFKIETGKQVFDREREQAKIAAVRGLAHGAFNAQAAEELFTQLMTISRRYQYRLLEQNGRKEELGFRQVDAIPTQGVKVVYQGMEGAYSHEAALAYFGEDAQIGHVRTWEDAMEAVESRDADYAVIPIENSSAGPVRDNFDLLLRHDNVIVAEICIPVDHMLLGLPGANLADICTVYSHPQALMQSCEYLNARSHWRQISVENTAVAAKKIISDQNKSQAAVASRAAGRLYGLKVLAEGINHNKNNATRFIILAKDHIYRKDAGKVTICFELPHRSGTLYNMLGNLIYNGVNMRMIESRPIAGRNWEYRFFVDVEGNLGDTAIQNALRSVSEEAANMRILGNY
ncbi:MAG: prephenate dehydratase [Hungatella sp.]|jgi:chorismate mutase/prephenate dehydratase|nr:prephenate dehydratase [Hungatella sp.]